MDTFQAGTHLVSIIRHLDNGFIGLLCRFFCIATDRSYQGCGKTGCRFHVFVSRHAGGFVGFRRILLHFAGRTFEKGIHAACKLFVGGIGFNSLFADVDHSLAEFFNGFNGQLDALGSEIAHEGAFENLAEFTSTATGFIHLVSGIVGSIT